MYSGAVSSAVEPTCAAKSPAVASERAEAAREPERKLRRSMKSPCDWKAIVQPIQWSAPTTSIARLRAMDERGAPTAIMVLLSLFALANLVYCTVQYNKAPSDYNSIASQRR